MQAFDFNTPNTKYSLLLTPALQSSTFEQVLERSHKIEKQQPKNDKATNHHGLEDETESCFFRFFFASYPPKEAEVDYTLSVEMQPLHVVFNEAIIERISTSCPCSVVDCTSLTTLLVAQPDFSDPQKEMYQARSCWKTRYQASWSSSEISPINNLHGFWSIKRSLICM